MATVSSELIQQLDVLMVEGDLLPVELDEQHSLVHVLTACDADAYGAKVFEFEVSFAVTYWRFFIDDNDVKNWC